MRRACQNPSNPLARTVSVAAPHRTGSHLGQSDWILSRTIGRSKPAGRCDHPPKVAGRRRLARAPYLQPGSGLARLALSEATIDADHMKVASCRFEVPTS
jgi:hypothetical protein